MEEKNLLTYCQPLVNIVTVQACCIVCNSPGPNSVANVDEDDYGTY
jgi:hypothetical protein